MDHIFGNQEPVGQVAQNLEALGYDSISCVDLFSYVDLEPFVALAAAAQATTDLRLCISVVGLPFRSPIQLAKLASSLDVLSDGRFTLGVGLGTVAKEFELENMNIKDRARVSDEYLDVLRKLLNETNVTHDGPRYRFDPFTLNPRPVQEPRLPIWVAGKWADGRNPGMVRPAVVRRVAQHGDGFVGNQFSPDGFRAYRDAILDQMDELDRDSNGFGWASGFVSYVGVTSEEVRDGLQPPESWHEPGSDNAPSEEDDRLGPHETRLTGTYDEVTKKIVGFMDAGVEDFILSWNGPPGCGMEQSRRFAERVLPNFRG
jgi:alkanesulfonate monooxygenase SsuD/methylene tetrahydromethanopterin reductase-like flavin-dependent oxidoreductase (luciferase family)